jgi:hypothetical protein
VGRRDRLAGRGALTKASGRAAVNGVDAAAAVDQVVALVAEELVVPPADQRVVAVPADQDGVGRQEVIAGAAIRVMRTVFSTSAAALMVSLPSTPLTVSRSVSAATAPEQVDVIGQPSERTCDCTVSFGA